MAQKKDETRASIASMNEQFDSMYTKAVDTFDHNFKLQIEQFKSNAIKETLNSINQVESGTVKISV